MDKRKNKILIGCLALLLVMTVGYALFSENITINGTATAKGSFDINATCQKGVPSELISAVHAIFGEAVENGYKNDTCSFVGDEGTFSVEFEYPGALRYFTVKMTNDGTIPAILGTPNSSNSNICFDHNDNGTYESNECSSTSDSPGWEMISMIPNIDLVGVQMGDNTIIPGNEITSDIQAEFEDSNGNRILKPGNSIFLVIETSIHQLIGTDNGGGLMASTQGTIEFPFTQITN